MTYNFYLTNEYSQNLLTVRDVTNDDNKLFQYKCTADETPPPATDNGYIWVTFVDPTQVTGGILLYNTFSEGFFGVTGTILTAGASKPEKAQIGTLTFFPTQLLNQVKFTAVQTNPGYYYIQSYINNATTDTYLVYDDEEDDISFMKIPSIPLKNEHLNIMWKINEIKADIPVTPPAV